MDLNRDQPRRLLPGFPSQPLWFSKQTEQQKAAVRQQANQCRYEGYDYFRRYISGQWQDGYISQLYHIGELTSQSFFLVYTFDRHAAPLLEFFALFVAVRLQPARCLITVEANFDYKVFYVRVDYDEPRGINLGEINHPGQVKLLSQLTWRVQNLTRWMLAQGPEAHLTFNIGHFTHERVQKMLSPIDETENKLKMESPLRLKLQY